MDLTILAHVLNKGGGMGPYMYVYIYVYIYIYIYMYTFGGPSLQCILLELNAHTCHFGSSWMPDTNCPPPCP